MVDDESMNNNERASQLAVAVGMLLFASVIFGSGVLGDAGEDRLSDGNDRGDDVDSNAASDREEENNRLRNDRMDGDIREDMASLEIACDDGEGEVEVREEGGKAEQRQVQGVRVALVARPIRVAPPLK